MESYKELSIRQEKEFAALPIFYAFSDKQFKEGLESFGLKDTDQGKVVKVGSGGFSLITDSKMIMELCQRHVDEMEAAINQDLTGEGFIFEMFDHELSNHEYCYTHDVGDTLRSCGLSAAEVSASPTLSHGLMLAKRENSRE